MGEPIVSVVTGATGAIGGAIARQLAQHGHVVVLAVRDVARGRSVAREIAAATGRHEPRVEAVDLSRRSDILALAERIEGPIHVLVNNASATPRKRELTPEGLEAQFATNVLGYFWMIEAFAARFDELEQVVNVASYWAGDLDLHDLQFERRPYDNDAAYRQSKQAERMLTVAFAERLPGVSINACHPGDVPSRLARSLGFGGHETPDAAARTPVLLATRPKPDRVSGRYFEHGQERPCRFGADRDGVEALFAACRAAGG